MSDFHREQNKVNYRFRNSGGDWICMYVTCSFILLQPCSETVDDYCLRQSELLIPRLFTRCRQARITKSWACTTVEGYSRRLFIMSSTHPNIIWFVNILLVRSPTATSSMISKQNTACRHKTNDHFLYHIVSFSSSTPRCNKPTMMNCSSPSLSMRECFYGLSITSNKLLKTRSKNNR